MAGASRTKIILVVAVVLCTLGAFLFNAISLPESDRVTSIKPADLSEPVPVRVSKETTYFTNPVRQNGLVNYVSALNERLSEGVTSNNNSVVPLAQILGSGIFQNHNESNVSFFELLGVPRPPIEKERFLLHLEYAREKTGHENTTFEKQLNTQIDQAIENAWDSSEYPELAEWLDYNSQFEATIHEAIQRDRYYCPIVSSRSGDPTDELLFCVLLPFQQQSRGFAEYLACKAMLAVHENELDSAIQCLLDCHRLGGHVGQGFTTIEGLVGIAIEALAFEAEIGLLQSGKMTNEQLINYQVQLSDYRVEFSIAEKIDSGERLMILDLIPRAYLQNPEVLQMFSSGDVEHFPAQTFLESHQGVDLNVVMSLINQQYDLLDSQLKGKSYPQQDRIIARMQEKYEKLSPGFK